MNEYEKMVALIEKDEKQELMDNIGRYIDKVRKNLHDEKNSIIDEAQTYELVMQSGKVAAMLSNKARKSEHGYLFAGGYLAAMVDEFRRHYDKQQRVNEFEMVYKTNIDKAHWREILTLLYLNGMVQNKVLVREAGVSASHLNKILSNMIEQRCITSYEFSKYKYYVLTWNFKKYLDSIDYGEMHRNTETSKKQEKTQRISDYELNLLYRKAGVADTVAYEISGKKNGQMDYIQYYKEALKRAMEEKLSTDYNEIHLFYISDNLNERAYGKKLYYNNRWFDDYNIDLRDNSFKDTCAITNYKRDLMYK